MTAAVQVSAPAGAAPDDRTRIERGILTVLEALSRRAGGYLEALDHYNGELADSDDALDDIKRRLRGRAPAVLVTAGTAQYSQTNVRKNRFEVEYRVEILCLSNHWRSREARHVGDVASATDAQADPGIYRVLYDVRQRLLGHSINVCGVEHLVPVAEQVMIQDADFTAWASVWEVTARVDRTPVPAVHNLESVQHDHNLVDADEVNPVTRGEVTKDG